MRLRAPPGCESVSHAEQTIHVDEFGHVDVHEDIANALLAHGFVHVIDNIPKPKPLKEIQDRKPLDVKSGEGPIESLNRQELFAFLRANGVSIKLPITNHDLRDLAETTRRHQMNGATLTNKGD
jgi:hypothetical protein